MGSLTSPGECRKNKKIQGEKTSNVWGGIERGTRGAEETKHPLIKRKKRRGGAKRERRCAENLAHHLSKSTLWLTRKR